MHETDMLIIGAGVAGLSAGCFAQANGYSSRILEMHTIPGGLCTAWERNGYTFDYCIHWLIGSGKNHGFRELWDFLGLCPEDGFVDHPIYVSRVTDQGPTVHWYNDPARLQAHFFDLTSDSGDRTLIKDLCRQIQAFSTFVLREPDLSPKGLGKLVQSFPALRAMKKAGKATWKSWWDQLKSPILREACGAFFGMKDFPLYAVLFTLGHMAGKNAGYPRGASLGMARGMEARYKSLGGTVEYRKKVAEILVEGNRATGVRCSDGTEYKARWIISAADVHATINQMLGRRFATPEWDRAFTELKPFPSPIQISFGVKLDQTVPGSPAKLCGMELDQFASIIDLPLKTPVSLEDRQIQRVGLHHYCYDPSMAPEGRTAVTFLLNGNLAWWQRFTYRSPEYKAEKERIVRDLLTSLDEILPGFSARVEVQDLATPLSNVHYTGNWQGSQEGFMMAPQKLPLPDRIQGLENFRLCGQWRHPGGGIPPSAMEGKTVIQGICKLEGRRFAMNAR